MCVCVCVCSFVFLFYSCRHFRFSCVGNNLLLDYNESVCFESDVEKMNNLSNGNFYFCYVRVKRARARDIRCLCLCFVVGVLLGRQGSVF